MAFRNQLILIVLIIIFPLTSSAHVNLKYPEGDETFEQNESITLEWEIAIDHGPCVWDLYYSTDAGESWQSIVKGIDKSTKSYDWTIPETETNKARIKVVQKNADYGNFSDESNNFTIKSASESDTTATAILPVNKKSFILESVSPNPFQNKTQITFKMYRPRHVNITIYSILGKKIKTLLRRKLTAGKHRVRWNASGVPKGVYLFRFSAGNRVVTRRIVRSK